MVKSSQNWVKPPLVKSSIASCDPIYVLDLIIFLALFPLIEMLIRVTNFFETEL